MENEPVKDLIQVKLREEGPCAYFSFENLAFKSGDTVIVEQDRGIDYGHVLSDGEDALKVNAKSEEIKKILRVANEEDLKRISENNEKAKEAFKTCQAKVEQYKLSMKLIDVEYSFDCGKVVFYFSSEERVDFRELVKDLARILRARIDMRQIGVRDEAKLIGGFGPCGRELCCKCFLKDFVPVTIKMAKEEGLPLNPPKISGICGRLMCCLTYEYELYKELGRSMPKEGERIQTPDGKGKVVSVNILKRKAYVELEDGKQIVIEYDKPNEAKGEDKRKKQ